MTSTGETVQLHELFDILHRAFLSTAP